MTGVAAPEVVRPPRATSRPPRRGRWRVPVRLAQRQVRRTWLSSLLITVLIALPIAGMAAYAIVAASMQGTPAERSRVELGLMEAWVTPVGSPDTGLWQSPTDPWFNGTPGDGYGIRPTDPGTPLDDPSAALPAGTETVRMTSSSADAVTPNGIARFSVWIGPAWDPRFAGRFDLVGGSAPAGPGEIAVTPATLERLDVDLGGAVRLTADPRAWTITGLIDDAEIPDSETAFFLPAAATSFLDDGGTRWYLPDLALTWADVQELNARGVIAYSRDVVAEDPSTGPGAEHWATTSTWDYLWTVYTVLIIGGIFAAYVVVMLAGAAFAVTARRQQRSLAIAASVGAPPRELFRTVLLQGTTLGAVGGFAGLALGVGVAAGIMSLTSNGSATQYWGFHLPWLVLVGILVFAVAVGTLAALVPARAVARSDALQSLRAARRPQRPGRARPVWGFVLLLIGVAVTLASAVVWLAARAQPQTAPFSPLHALPPYGIIAGPIIVQIGVLVSGGWLLWTLSRGLSRVSVAARIASRDAAANAGRTVPAFAAIAATVFIGVFAFAQTAMQSAETERQWFYNAPVGNISVTVWPSFDGPGADTRDVEEIAVALAERAGAVATGVIARQDQDAIWSAMDAGEIDDDLTYSLARVPERYLLDPEVTTSYTSFGFDPGNPISVVEPDDLTVVLGLDVSAADLAAYREGAALVVDPRYITEGAVEIATWTDADVWQGLVPDNVWLPFGDRPWAEPLATERVPAFTVTAPRQPIALAIAPATAERLGMTVALERVVGQLDTPLSTAERDRMREQAELAGGSDVVLYAAVEDGPPSQLTWMLPLLAGVSVLVLGASAVALGLARFERRPDDATLAAIGATRGLRRRVAFWQGLIVAGFGTLAGLAAGILPPIGFAIEAADRLRLADVPWGLLCAFAIGLPLLVAVVNALVPPRTPELTRRTAIT